MFNAVRRNLISKVAPVAPLVHCAAVRLSDNHDAPIIQGPGAPAGRTPTDFDQSTGYDRAEHLAALEGKEFFDMGPLELTKKGTKAEPTIVPSGAESRIVGCCGAPGEDHELIWLVIEREHAFDRCPECGNVYKLSDKGFDPENLGTANHHHDH
ncbi:cytochrome c oxidase subunit VB-domain-containing protein [Kickxella alabastrina]|uniref:cytochrome c oxidase subunit VB-domain-containing protein n=1 Tax=Kickxella alabastrina TaxID=61397 RepID=UPI00221FC5BD|nr:cytochrome c oxidase subunit VB-domain-containing protein [Kickxella alabastrina]KAI7833741.1 cytochrome c oxidase subunit VB-domain-containing protein [Kickxella alabastrina]